MRNKKYDPNKSKKNKHRIDLCLNDKEYEILITIMNNTKNNTKQKAIVESLKMTLTLILEGGSYEQYPDWFNQKN